MKMSYEYLILSIVMFVLSVLLFLRSRNLIMNLVSIELMLNSLNLILAFAAIVWGNVEPLVIIFLIFAITASEAAIGLSIIILISKKLKTIDTDLISKIREYYK
jgi:NADH-quinone oxidoreductase subunit K